jgi:hypothetical protein
LLSLETKVWDALVQGDAAADEALLASDFVGLYPTGFANRSQHTGQLRDGPTMASFMITHATVVAISDDAALLCYRADYYPVRRGVRGDLETMYVSSLWCEIDGRWLNVFSQDTPVA